MISNPAEAATKAVDEITRLVERLGHGEAAEDEAALALLTIHGRRAVESLVAASADSEPRRRASCLTALGRIGDQRARRTVIFALADPSPLVRLAAATALAAFPSPEGIARLRAMLKREAEAEVRLRGVATLVDLFDGGAVEALDPLLSILADRAEDRRVRLEAVKVLGLLPAGEARQLAAGLSGDPDSKVREAATGWSSAPSRPDSGTEQALLDLASADYFTQRDAAGILARSGEGAVPALVKSLRERSSDPAACARVASVLRTITRGRERALTAYLDETDETLPLALLVDIIGESGDRTALYHLKGVIDRLESAGPRQDSAREMILAKSHYYLARAGSRVAFESLKRALSRQMGSLMGEILMAVEEIGGRDELLELLSHYGREEGWMKDRVRETFRRLMRRSRVRPDDPIFERLDDTRRAWLLEILSAPGPRPGPARRSHRRHVDTG
ncbi:MAG TPA: HEAT repeat domain-containing protein [Candidatus Polarisedimenticolia bacterium]|jgi:HEAT repeat protein